MVLEFAMTWPLVSRRAYDEVRAERDYLRERNEALQDAILRLERRAVGLPETPRQPKPAPEPMPKVLWDYIAGFENPVSRRQMREVAHRRYLAGEPWDRIVEDTLPPEEPDDVE